MTHKGRLYKTHIYKKGKAQINPLSLSLSLSLFPALLFKKFPGSQRFTNYSTLGERCKRLPCISHNAEQAGSNTPVLLAVVRARALPGIIVHAEEDGLVANGIEDGANGDGLVGDAGDVQADGAARGGETRLKNVAADTTTHLLDNLELALDKVTGVAGGDG